MRRLGAFINCIGLVVAVLASGGVASANTPVTGAAFTTVNEGVDGTDHCKNGSPLTNCNIYNGKQYVWLNGGPSVAYVGDGDYFFAVLCPGGQADPNDGADKNLSSPHDDYTNRTFSVAGGDVTYSGTHDFDSNKIRLMPYDDTCNPGGVYILAICSLADSYPVDPSDCKYDAFKIQEGNVVEKGLPLTITKDAAGTFDKTWTWEIQKDVDKTYVQQVGGSVTFHYTVTVSHDSGTVSDIHVTGTISVFNPNVDGSNNTVGVDIDGVTDQLSDGTPCTVTDGGAQTLTTFQTDFAYSCDLTALPQGQLDNTASVSWSEQFLDNGTLLDAGSADFKFTEIGFTETKIDDCVDVTDDNFTPLDTSDDTALGTVCVGDDSPTIFHYDRTITVRAGCHDYTNTATFETNTTGTTGSADQTVTVCGPVRTGALTIGFWKTTNGNGLINKYCAPSGKTSLATYLSTLGPTNQGPFANATGTCANLVTYVNSILKGATATNMNIMLRAQMLGTALDVYFSDPNLGWTSTKIGTTKPPSVFFSGIAPLGSFVMDLTAICPMVDNTTTGTATCKLGLPSTDGFASGAYPWDHRSVQGILNYESTVPPFNGSTTTPVWYAGNRTLEEIVKNTFDQINNQDAFAY